MGSIFSNLAYVFKLEIEGIRIIDLIKMFAVLAVLVFGPGTILHKKGIISRKRLMYIFLLLAFAGIVLSITIFRRPMGSREGIVHLYPYLGFGLKSGHPSGWAGAISMLNIFLFIPVGMLAFPVYRSRSWHRSMALTTLTGALISLIIECTQYITGRGMFEIADILTNTAGSLIGAILAIGLNHLIQTLLEHKTLNRSFFRRVL